MAKHVYQTRSAVTQYDRSHGLLDQAGDPIPSAKSFFDRLAVQLTASLPQKADLSLIDMGVGHGGFVFLPLLGKLASQNKNVTLTVGVDNSEPMLIEYAKRFRRAFSNSILAKLEQLPCANTTGNFFLAADIEHLVAGIAANTQRFDVVVLTGVLHHSLNWRAVLSSVAKNLLSSNGVIILAERDMEADFFDGNFYQHLDFINEARSVVGINPNPWRRVWSTVYGKRADLGVYWEPEVRISDATPCIAFLLEIGFAQTSWSPFKGCWDNTYTCNDLKNWLENPAFSNFSRGVTSTVRQELLNEVKACQATKFDVKESWRYYALWRP